MAPTDQQDDVNANSASTGDVADEPHGNRDRAAGFAAHHLHDLKGKTARGALVSTFSQGANFVLRLGSMVVLARILAPADFGLVGMVTACTGFLQLFRDAGLSMATIQRASISREQTSMLFWVNLVIGGVLAALCAAVAPILTRFYHEPRLFWMTVILGTSFVLNGAAAQHRAVLQRNMRFAVLAIIDVTSIVASVSLGIGMAMAGQGYWALVGMVICQNAVGLLGVWTAGGWLPVGPRRGTGVISMLKYGGTVTLNNLVAYIAANADKVLLGRFWGAEALGIYGRAYQLINLPTENLNATIGMVAFPALSRLQNDPERLRNYFLKGYSLFLSLVMPITIGCALFAEDIVRVFLGPKWGATVPLFRLLAPTIFSFALVNPLTWLMLATGKAKRSLKIGLVIAPCMILGYAAGLRYGPAGVAAGFSIALALCVAPIIYWATRGTPVSAIDTVKVLIRPLLAILVGAGATLMAWPLIHSLEPVLLRLFVANAVLFGVYTGVLLFVMGQKAVYLGLIREIGVWPLAGRRRKEKRVGNDETAGKDNLGK
jgi:O-antigen/teichoic acid export membrane protein